MRLLTVHTVKGEFVYSGEDGHTTHFPRERTRLGILEVVADRQEGDGSPGVETVVEVFPLEEVLGWTDES